MSANNWLEIVTTVPSEFFAYVLVFVYKFKILASSVINLPYIVVISVLSNTYAALIASYKVLFAFIKFYKNKKFEEIFVP